MLTKCTVEPLVFLAIGIISIRSILFVTIFCSMLHFLDDCNLINSLMNFAIPEVRRGGMRGSPESLLYRFVPSVLQILIRGHFLFLVAS